MPRANILTILLTLLVLACTTRTPLGDLPLNEQREIGEAAAAEVCGFELDVESEITRRHREARDVAMEYIAIASEAATEGELSRFFSAETLAACGPDAVEWGGVRAAIGHLVARYGTETEMLEHLKQVSAPDLFCEMVPRMSDLSRYRIVCEQLDVVERSNAQ